MNAMEVVEAWDRSLRAGDWQAARSWLAEDATYTTPEASEDERISCATPDQIVELMRSWKGKLPDVEVVSWEALGESVLARLRQPAFGDDADWFQVLTVSSGLIATLKDFPTQDLAERAVTRSA